MAVGLQEERVAHESHKEPVYDDADVRSWTHITFMAERARQSGDVDYITDESRSPVVGSCECDAEGATRRTGDGGPPELGNEDPEGRNKEGEEDFPLE